MLVLTSAKCQVIGMTNGAPRQRSIPMGKLGSGCLQQLRTHYNPTRVTYLMGPLPQLTEPWVKTGFLIGSLSKESLEMAKEFWLLLAYPLVN